MTWPAPEPLLAALQQSSARRANAMSRLQLLSSPTHPVIEGVVEVAARSLGATYAALVLVDGRLARVHAATHQVTRVSKVETSLAALAIVSEDRDLAELLTDPPADAPPADALPADAPPADPPADAAAPDEPADAAAAAPDAVNAPAADGASPPGRTMPPPSGRAAAPPPGRDVSPQAGPRVVPGIDPTPAMVTIDVAREHPSGLELATEAAVVVRAPNGVAIGALELGWSEHRDLDASTEAAMAELATLIDGVLELRAEVEEYRRFVELSPDPVAILDLAGSVEEANPALLRLLDHRDASAMQRRPFVTLVARPDRTRVASALTRVPFSRATANQLDAGMMRSDGTVLPCALSIGLLGGTHRYLQVVIHDLSGRVRDEEARTQLSEQLARAQRLDAVGQIAGGLAHDLNNLLVVMSTNLSLAMESLDDAEVATSDTAAHLPLREDLAEVTAAVDRATALTSRLLDFARRQQGEDDRTDVAELVGALRGLVARTLPTDVHLAVDVPDDLPLVACDPVQLERALLNLVNNARDAVDEAGTITIRAEEDLVGAVGQERRADLADERLRSSVRLEVSDDGTGMDELTRTRAFEPLFTTKTDGRGSGLGLSAVLAFADEVGARLELTSAVGEGTTLTLNLPVEAPEAVPVGVDRPVGGSRVLLVDPGERTRRVIDRMLTGAGYRVSTFGTGEDALTALEATGAELLVTELVLPGMTGTRLIEAARQHSPNLPVVVLASVEAPRALEGDPVLVKPFSQLRLLRTVDRVLSGR